MRTYASSASHRRTRKRIRVEVNRNTRASFVLFHLILTASSFYCLPPLRYGYVILIIADRRRRKNHIHKSFASNTGMLSLFTIAIFSYVVYRIYQHFFPTPNIDPKGKYVLISGCDSGFGHGLAVELDRQGFNVLAGVLLDKSVASLKSELSSRAVVFRLDITKQDDIDAAYDLIKTKTNTLHALVNNAGIGGGGYIDWTSMATMRKLMDVNFFGHVAMTKKMLPLLIVKRDSRVVNVCSAAGYIASSGMSAYCASKFALESFSDCLRREMAPWKLRVSIIEPGFMRTPIIQGRSYSFADFWTTLSDDVRERWGKEFLEENFNAFYKSPLIRFAEDPIKVVRVLQHAVINTAPCIRYRPGIQSSVYLFPLSMLPTWLTDWILIKTRSVSSIPASVAKQITD
jgi:NAD(P)-dependent dehydrogenase (short-subunit alcohol dehydrogenase family)